MGEMPRSHWPDEVGRNSQRVQMNAFTGVPPPRTVRGSFLLSTNASALCSHSVFPQTGQAGSSEAMPGLSRRRGRRGKSARARTSAVTSLPSITASACDRTRWMPRTRRSARPCRIRLQASKTVVYGGAEFCRRRATAGRSRTTGCRPRKSRKRTRSQRRSRLCRLAAPRRRALRFFPSQARLRSALCR